jgi:hypothetical protein
MIIHFERKIGYHLSSKAVHYWQPYFNIEISYGNLGNVVARRKCKHLNKEIYKDICDILKEFKSVRYEGLFLGRLIASLTFGGEMKFTFKRPEDEAHFILKYTEGMSI